MNCPADSARAPDIVPYWSIAHKLGHDKVIAGNIPDSTQRPRFGQGPPVGGRRIRPGRDYQSGCCVNRASRGERLSDRYARAYWSPEIISPRQSAPPVMGCPLRRIALEDSQPGAGWLKVVFWHNPDLQRPLELGPIMATLPTFGAECRFTVVFQTQFQAVPKVAV